MKEVRITMSDEVHANLLARVKAAGLPDLESYFSIVVLGNPESETLMLYRKAHRRFDTCWPVSAVTVAELLGEDWACLDRVQRIAVGKMFMAAVKNGLIEASVARNSGGHAVYSSLI